MIELESTKIRNKILILCEFYEDLLNQEELQFREGNRETHLREIEKIKEQVMLSKTFRLAFVGEYNSGKTSIINILTGNKFPVSSTVETDKSTEISWNNITIVDTPGLGSGLAKHDKLTKEWLAKADLLVYVLTPDLLTEKGGERLLNMLDVYKREHEMMIVMNMIDQEGNDVSVYREDLQSHLEPRPLDLYYPVFMSAKYKEKSDASDLNDDERRYFMEKSRFNTFVNTLNEFILNRREKAALTTPLTRLQTLSMKMAFKNKFDKECALLDLNIGIYESAVRDMKVAFDDFKGDLKDTAEGTAGNIFQALDDTNSDIKIVIEDETKSYILKVQDSVNYLEGKVGNITENLQVEGARIDSSDLGVEVAKRIEKSETLKAIFKVGFPKADDKSKTKEYIDQLIKQIEGMDPDISGLGIEKDIREMMGEKNVLVLTGKLVAKINRDVVLKIGHIIGHKFKPWDAVKLSSKFTKAVPLINLAAVVIEVIMSIRNKKKEEDTQKHLREFKEEVNLMLEKIVEETQEMLKTQILAPVEASINIGMKLLKDKKVELIEFSEKNKDLALEIESKRDECMKIYDEIYVRT